MKRLLLSTLLAASPLICAAQYGVGISLQVGDPNFYGPININDGPPPQVLYSDPVIAIPDGGYYPPLYLRVPVIYYRDWPRYCHYYSSYNACNRPVYFVQDDWYFNTYTTYYQSRHRHGRGFYHDRRGYGGNRVVIHDHDHRR